MVAGGGRESMLAVGWRSAWASVGLAWRWACGSLALLVATTLIRALMPALQVRCVAWLVRSITEDHPWQVPVVVTAVVAGGTFVATALTTQASARLGYVMTVSASNELAATIATIPPSTLADPGVSVDLQAARDATGAVSGQPGNVLSVVGAVVTAVSLFVSVWALDHVAAVAVLAALVPGLVAFTVIARFQKSSLAGLALNRRWVNYYTDQLVFQRPATELASLGTAGRVAEWAGQRQLQIQRTQLAYLRRVARAEVCNAAATILMLAGALWSMAATAGPGRASSAAAGAAAGILGVISGINATRGAGYSVGQILTDAPEVTIYRQALQRRRPLTAQPAAGAVDTLAAEGLSVRYPGRATDALHGASLQARRGQIVALVGANGAGKTSLVNALLGLVPVTEGRVLVDGRGTAGMGEQERLALFGLLTQEFGRYDLTVRQALLLGTPRDHVGDDELWAALEAARAAGFVRAMPDGLDTQLGQQWGGVGISGGQWQRLALARIHLRGAPIWILDEPTSAIDAETETQIFDELTATKTGRITIVVSHRATTLRGMDRIHVLNHGHIVETGTYQQLLHAHGRFAQIFARELDPQP